MDNRDARKVYADIIDLPHHQSDKRPRMTPHDRAAQFAPFAALTGYDEMIAEEGRLTSRQRELTEEETEILGHKLEIIRGALGRGEKPSAAFTHFVPDERKAGGRYEVTAGAVKKIDLIKRLVVLYGSEDPSDRRVPTINIPIDSIIDITGEMFRSAEIF